jgi:diacylglycerol kinase family enzyme
MTRNRAAAIAALVLAAVSVGLLLWAIVPEFPPDLDVVAGFAAAVAAGWYGIRRRGIARALGLGAALVLLTAVLVLTAVRRADVEEFLAVVAYVLCVIAARAAFTVHARLPDAEPPRHPVLFWNPKSGGGKALEHDLPGEARRRGIEAVELRPGDDLETLARAAVQRGADGLAMAGGDGSQAIVAMVAAEYDLPYACVPAGTRNHFALDLGVDRDDVVGALDAFVDGGERQVDLGTVNGRVFVNNVSLGLYAEAVRREGYRDAKLRTLLDTVPEVLAPGDGEPLDLRWTSPEGTPHRSAVVILVSNNVYRLGRVLDSGTRPRIDDGLLGITVLGAPRGRGRRGRALQRPWRDWSAPAFVVDSDAPIAAGIDGESLELEPPLAFAIRPLALRVRIARRHPGASPSAAAPEGLRDGLRRLVAIAGGRSPLELGAVRPQAAEPPR